MKTLCLRFDIDTPTCLREGVPRILDLTEAMDFRATFFLSVGRGVSRWGALSRIVTRSRSRTPRAEGFSALTKLGPVEYARLALLNPEIGRGAPDVTRRLASAGEVGLHGGTNHDLWQHHAHEWPRARVEAELDWALAWTKEMGIHVEGFSSPGWNEAPDLPELLKARGFRYRADRYGTDMRGGVEEIEGFFNVATNLLGEPGGVAYIEHMRARGLTDAEIRASFKSSLVRLKGDVVLYDHPYYAGLQAVPLMRDLVQIARDTGFELVTLAEMTQDSGGRHPSPEAER